MAWECFAVDSKCRALPPIAHILNSFLLSFRICFLAFFRWRWRTIADACLIAAAAVAALPQAGFRLTKLIDAAPPLLLDGVHLEVTSYRSVEAKQAQECPFGTEKIGTYRCLPPAHVALSCRRLDLAPGPAWPDCSELSDAAT
eukprot:SAG31_NODE_22376_length_527_cov_0.792056_1_plen_142_part_01